MSILGTAEEGLIYPKYCCFSNYIRYLKTFCFSVILPHLCSSTILIMKELLLGVSMKCLNHLADIETHVSTPIVKHLKMFIVPT